MVERRHSQRDRRESMKVTDDTRDDTFTVTEVRVLKKVAKLALLVMYLLAILSAMVGLQKVFNISFDTISSSHK